MTNEQACVPKDTNSGVCPPAPLRHQLEIHRGTLESIVVGTRRRGLRVPSRNKGNAREIAVADIRAALMFLARTFSDVSLLTYGFVRGYPDPRNRAELEAEAQALVDAILLGERAFGKNAGSDTRRRAQRRAYYAGLHAAHDEAGTATPFCFNDAEVEQQLAYATG